MKVWVLRHGEAQAQATSDRERPLTPTGLTQAQGVGQFIAEHAAIDRVFVSPYLRAQQTCAEVLRPLGLTAQTVDWLTPDVSPEQVIDALERMQGEEQVWEVLLVSHQPLVSQLVSLLVDGHLQGYYPMAPASLVALEGDFVAPGLMHVVQTRHA